MTVIQEQWLKVWLDKQTLSNGIDAKELLAELAALPEIQDAVLAATSSMNVSVMFELSSSG